MSKKERKSILDFSDFEVPQKNSINNEINKKEINNTGDFSFTFSKKATIEETHRRQTWLIKNELIERLERLAAGKPRGFKTKLINNAIEFAISELEKKNYKGDDLL